MQHRRLVSLAPVVAAAFFTSCTDAPAADVRSSESLASGALTAVACGRNGDSESWVERCTGPSALLPTGQRITPLAVPGSTLQLLNPGLAPPFDEFVVGQLMSEAQSPSGRTLALLTSGYNNNYDGSGNLVPAASNEYVFIFDTTANAPQLRQVIRVADTYQGIAFTPDGRRLIVSGGGDDSLHVYADTGSWTEEAGSPVALGHAASPTTAPWSTVPGAALGLAQGPMAQGLAITGDGRLAVVANRYNDSITVVDLAAHAVVAEKDLRPGKNGGVAGTPGGSYPSSVAIAGSSVAFVASERDREIVVVDLTAPATPAVIGRVPVPGVPTRLLLGGTSLYVALENTDAVAVIDTTTRTITATIPVAVPDDEETPRYKGASPNALALSPDGGTLYVSNRGTNAIAVVSLTQRRPRVEALLPTGWYPADVVVSSDGSTLYVVNLKSLPGANEGNCLGYQSAPCPVPGSPVVFAPNQYIENLNKGGFATLPVPRDRSVAERLTRLVAANNGLTFEPKREDRRVMAELRRRVHHVIYVVKENRTYDQVLGDLGRGNGDPSLTEFPFTTTPSLHDAARKFVDLDNFHDSGEVSGNGWPWSTAARESEAGARMLPVNYACSPLGGVHCAVGRGGSYDWEGTNRNINVGLAAPARFTENPLLAVLTSPDGNPAHADLDVLPGTADVAAPDGPDGEQGKGYLWSAALRAGVSVRNYGFFADLTLYHLPASVGGLPVDRTPFASGKRQTVAANAELAPLTDPFFRGFDDAYPDFYREAEWEREFSGYVARGDLPALSLVRLMADHTGSFASAIDGVNTPDVQVADNDYAVGRLLEAVAHSRYAADTLVFVVEDDAQDGPDHVDAHRSTAFVVGPYVKQGAVVSTHYTTVNMLRTITDVLGLDHLGLLDATQGPMTDVFDLSRERWTFAAKASGLLRGTTLPIPATAFASAARAPAHPASYWIARTRGMDFSVEDRVDTARYNAILWAGLMGDRPYPVRRLAQNAR